MMSKRIPPWREWKPFLLFGKISQKPFLYEKSITIPLRAKDLMRKEIRPLNNSLAKNILSNKRPQAIFPPPQIYLLCTNIIYFFFLSVIKKRPPYFFIIFKIALVIPGAKHARLSVAECCTSYPVYNSVNKLLFFTHFHSELSFLKVFVFSQLHTDNHN